MTRLRWPRSRMIWPLLLGPLLVGCVDSSEARNETQTSSAGQHPVPFHDANAGSGLEGSAAAQEISPPTGLPFQDSQNLPVGTLLTVRLKDPLSADDSGTGSTFEAVVDKPIVIQGNTLVPRGASVAGRVESARASALERNRGYVRLTLDEVAIAGRDLPIQTSSLFARANADGTQDSSGAHRASTGTIHLEKGRQLTFRLAEPVYVVGQRPLLTH
jgi:hypothetical protein